MVNLGPSSKFYASPSDLVKVPASIVSVVSITDVVVSIIITVVVSEVVKINSTFCNHRNQFDFEF